MINLSLRYVWIILAVSAFVSTAWMFRYTTTPMQFGYVVLDRWTGTTTTCGVTGC